MKRQILISLMCFLPVFYTGSMLASSQGEDYAVSSLLSEGQWFKLAVKEEGIYRIEFSKLSQLGLSDPSNPRIFGNNMGQLSYYNDDPSPDDLREIPVMLFKGNDNIFNEGDYLLFYAQGTHRWRYNSSSGVYDFIRHNYSDSAYYFLTSGTITGRHVADAPEIDDPSTYSTNSYDALCRHEAETENLIKSGREWYQPLSTLNGIVINHGFSNLMPAESIYYSIRVIARSPLASVFRLYDGENVVASAMTPEVNIFSSTGTFASEGFTEGSYLPPAGTPSIQVRFFNNGESSAKGWLDYLTLRARVSLRYSGNTLFFSDSRSVAPGRITDFTVNVTSGQPSSVTIWDITDPFNVYRISATTVTGSNISFRAQTDTLKKYAAFSPSALLSPVIRNTPLANQNLHGSPEAEMIIITHPLFIKYALKLASFHKSNSGLSSIIVTPEQIYNEFSGGIPDIAGIRNFIRMKYLSQENSNTPLKYLLLFGDGSFENKTLPPANPNFIPTYQSQNSTIIVSSFTSDDFYGLLENGEGEATGTEDIGIGRFPVSDTLQASVMVAKVMLYMSSENSGNWKNVINLTADDEDGNTHMIDAEGLYALVNSTYPDFNIDKIYLDAFRQITSVNGQSYPDVTKAINDRINSGCLIFDYLGHGNEIGLAHERVVKTENINSWKNGSKLPLFITATCEFSRFDDIEMNPVTREMVGKNSAGEMVIINPDGGGIALMTTTRVVYSAPNYTLNRNILYYAFTRDSTGNVLRLGDIIRLAKLNSGSGMNKRNFSLLGDPAVRLAYPWYGKVVTDSINSESVTMPVDSMKALSVITISGHVEDYSGNLMHGFDGTVYPLVFDKSKRVRTLANDGGQPMDYDMRNNVLFSGKTKASEGRFRFSFIVPKDIDYSYGNGKISYYASDNESDMGGSYSSFIVGGFTSASATDTSGPEIDLYLNDTLFRNGGIAGTDPVLLAVIEDDGGINTTGNGIGHDLTAFIDDERNKSFVLNNYFETDLDNYRKGRIIYQLSDISGGDHSITLKAWDNFNNSSIASLRFLVRTEDGFVINNLLNYPNPFADETKITAEHNRPDDELRIIVRIYSAGGTLLKIIETTIPSTGYRIPPVVWDGRNEGGDKLSRGIYPYSVTVSTLSGETAKATGRMIIL